MFERGAEGIVYILSLLFCVTIGHFFRNLQDKEIKRNYGALVGFCICYLICQQHVIHSIFMVWGNIILLRCSERTQVHKISLGFTFFYLAFIANQYRDMPFMLMIYKTITLRLVGLAFEVRNAQIHQTEPMKFSAGNEVPTILDTIIYAYYYIGLHSGPYYTWTVFNDYIYRDIEVTSDCTYVTERNLKKTIITTLCYTGLRIKYSPWLYYKDEFYNSSADYRFLFNIPHLVMYFMKYQTIMSLSSCVCTEAAFGLYTVKECPKPAVGATNGKSIQTTSSLTSKTVSETSLVPRSHIFSHVVTEHYSFAMLKSFDLEGIIVGPYMRNTLRSWNTATQYWFWAYIYNDLLKRNNSNKPIRNGLSFLTWAVWNGSNIQQFIIAITLWIHVNLETEFSELHMTDNNEHKVPWFVCFSFSRIICLVYLTPLFMNCELSTILRYYNSILWIYHLMLVILMVTSVMLVRKRGVYRSNTEVAIKN